VEVGSTVAAAPARTHELRAGRHAIIEQLLADGITHMFGNPGTVEQGFLDALCDYPEFRYVLALQEAAVVGMADGYVRATKKPVVVQLHSGVGLGNGIGMMYQAKRGHAPLVVIAGEAGVRYDAMDAQMAADLVGMARPVTKWATRVLDGNSLLRVLRRAIKVAGTAPMGPVFVSMPMDVLDAVNQEPVVPTSIPITRVQPDESAVREAAAKLAHARNPIIIMGDGVAAAGAQEELTRVAEILAARVWGADCSEVNFSFKHPLYGGLLGHMFGEHSKAILRDADAVLVCGTYLLPEVFPSLDPIFAPATPVVQIDLDAYEIAKNFPVDLGLVADPRLTLKALAAALRGTLADAEVEAARERLASAESMQLRDSEEQRRSDRANWDEVPMRPARFMAELAARLPADAIVFDEALTASPELMRYLTPSVPGQYFQTRGGSLGVGITGAIGIKLAQPERVVFGFSGDGGSMYTPQALWTAAHHQIGAKFVVCNNRSYKLLKVNIQEYWRERRIPEHDFPSSFDLGDPPIRFDQLAGSMGIRATRVERPEQIGGALDAALADDAPFLIDLVLSDAVPGHVAHVRGVGQ
jgi:benzoylformate decarboxylase